MDRKTSTHLFLASANAPVIIMGQGMTKYRIEFDRYVLGAKGP